MCVPPYPDTIYSQEPGLPDDYRQEIRLIEKQVITHFLACLENDQNTRFVDRTQTDIKSRNTLQTDCLVRDSRMGSLIAVEYSQIREPFLYSMSGKGKDFVSIG